MTHPAIATKIVNFRRTRNTNAELGRNVAGETGKTDSINALVRKFFGNADLVIGGAGQIFTDATRSRSLKKADVERFAASLPE